MGLITNQTKYGWIRGSEVYNRPIKSLLQDSNIRICSTHNKEKSVVAERFIRTLKNKNYNYMTWKSKNVYIDKLDDIVNKYNETKTYLSTIKMKTIDVKSSKYFDFDKKW